MPHYRNVKRSVLLIMILFSSASLHGQFNDSVFYLIRYTGTGIINHTNETSSYLINNGLKFSIVKKEVALNSTSSWVYGEQQHQITNNDFTTSLDVNFYRINKKYYYWGLGSYESSFSLKVNNRMQMGAGVAYKLADTTGLFISLSDGILYEFADLQRSDATKDIYSTFRNSFRFRLRWVIKNLVKLENVSFLQNSLQQKGDYIVNSNTSASVKLFKWFSLTTALNYNKVTRNNRDNLQFTFGITAENYF